MKSRVTTHTTCKKLQSLAYTQINKQLPQKHRVCAAMLHSYPFMVIYYIYTESNIRPFRFSGINSVLYYRWMNIKGDNSMRGKHTHTRVLDAVWRWSEILNGRTLGCFLRRTSLSLLYVSIRIPHAAQRRKPAACPRRTPKRPGQEFHQIGKDPFFIGGQKKRHGFIPRI